MNIPKLPKKSNPIDDEIARLFDELSNMPTFSEQYAATNEQLLKLYQLKAETKAKTRVSPDALLGAAVSLLGMVAIVNHEETHALTSKAMNFIKLGKTS